MQKIINSMAIKLPSNFSFKSKKFYFILLFISIGFFLSISQILGLSPDYSQYDDFFTLVRLEQFNVLVISRFEFGFSILVVIMTMAFTSNLTIYAWIVAVVMLFKGWVISIYSSNLKVFFLVAIFYFSRYFPLYELTQLRAACAIGFLMTAATFLWNGNRRYGLLACVGALLFHMSSAMVIPALFYQPIKRLHVMTVSVGVFVLILIGANFITNYLGSYISVFAGYQELGFGEQTPNPLSIALVLDWGMICVALIKWNSISLMMRRVVFLELLGMTIFYGFLDFPVIAHRFRELLSVFWIFFVMDGLRLNTLKLPTAGFVLVSIVFYSYSFILSRTFFH